jgi:hypothetical protein
MVCIKKDLTLVTRAGAEQPVFEQPVGHKVSPNITFVSAERLAAAKTAYPLHRVDLERASTLLTSDVAPRAGDVVLARVEKVGQHAKIELTTGRRATLFVGDEIIVCYGNRYAPDQFEAVVPGDLGQCHLVAAGGIAARALSKHGSVRSPTVIKPLGLLGDGLGRRLNLTDAALEKPEHDGTCSHRPLTVAVVGSSMSAGKTATAANLIRGLVTSGMRVGAAKVTGTGAGADVWLMRDAGADPVVDFTDAGMASTYLASIEQIEEGMNTLLCHLCTARVDVIVFEVADGLYQGETAGLLSSGYFESAVDGVIFAAGDALAAAAGVEWLKQHNLPIWALSGVITLAPLAVREVQRATGLPVLDSQMLRDPAIAANLEQQARLQMPVAQVG